MGKIRKLFFTRLERTSPSDNNRLTPGSKKPHQVLSSTLFSHPDYTVGSGVSPDQPPKWVADFTAGWESHPAPKNIFYAIILLPSYRAVKPCLTMVLCIFIINYTVFYASALTI